MKDISIPPNAMSKIIEQLRSLTVVDGPLEDDNHDMRLGELQAEIEALSREQQHELVALMWVGRGDFTEEQWEEAVDLARERHVGPCFDYVMAHPLAPDELAIGLEEIGHDHLLVDGTY